MSFKKATNFALNFILYLYQKDLSELTKQFDVIVHKECALHNLTRNKSNGRRCTAEASDCIVDSPLLRSIGVSRSGMTQTMYLSANISLKEIWIEVV